MAEPQKITMTWKQVENAIKNLDSELAVIDVRLKDVQSRMDRTSPNSSRFSELVSKETGLLLQEKEVIGAIEEINKMVQQAKGGENGIPATQTR